MSAGQMVSFCLTNTDINVSARPIVFPNFAFSPKKKRFNRILVPVRAHSSSSSIASIDVEFKPSFDDYLKAMESVKTVREKRNKTRNGGQSGNLGDFHENLDGNECRGAQEDKGNKRDSIPNSFRDENRSAYIKNARWEKDKSNLAEEDNGSNSIRDEAKSVYMKNARWVKDKNSIAEEDNGSNSIRDENKSVYMKNARWTKDKSNIAEEDNGSNSIQDENKNVYTKNASWVKDKRNMAEEDNGSNLIRDEFPKVNERNVAYGKDVRNSIKGERKIVYGENLRWVREKSNIVEEYDGINKVNERKIWYGKDVRLGKKKTDVGLEDNVYGGSFRNSIRDEPEINERKFDVQSSERFDTHERNTRWEKNQGNTFVKEGDYGFKFDEDRTRGRELTYGRNVRWEENQGKIDSIREKDRNFRNEKDRIRGTKMVLGNGKFPVDNVAVRRRNRNDEEESDGDEESGFERAAFKSIGGFNDIVDKPRISRNEMEERIQKLARCLNGADVNMPEWMFSKMIRSAKIRFSDHSILRIIQLLGNLGNWRCALQVIDWLQSRERFKSHKLRFIYTTALGVLGKARRPVEALNLYQTMQQNISTYPDLVAYHSIAVTLGQAGHMRELFEVIDIMKSPPKKKFRNGILEKWDPRLEPDMVVYNAVLNACVRRKQWEGAFWVLQQLEEKKQLPSATTYGLVMEVMLACGKYNLVHEFFRKVTKSSIPNALTYKVLVNTLWREGKADEALLVVKDMERRGVVGSAALYYDLARCLCSAGRCQEALFQVDKICRVANKPLVVTYTGLMQACIDAGNIEDGAYIFKHMHKFCSPNLVTCNIILKAYIDHGKFEEATSLFHKLLENGNSFCSKEDNKDRVLPDIYSFNIMLDTCVQRKEWDKFEVVFKGMLQYGYSFNAKRHLRMILDAGRAGKWGLLETTWNHLIKNGQIPPPRPLIKEMFCIKLENGDYPAALSYILTHDPTNLQVFSRKAWLNIFNENAHRLEKDTLIRLVHEVSLITSKTDAQQLIFQNLVLACREFLNTRTSVSQSNFVETQTVLC